jgi:hypothetical protein
MLFFKFFEDNGCISQVQLEETLSRNHSPTIYAVTNVFLRIDHEPFSYDPDFIREPQVEAEQSIKAIHSDHRIEIPRLVTADIEGPLLKVGIHETLRR